MFALSTADILTIWERGQGQRPLERSLSILVGCCPCLTEGDLALLPIAQRDALLLCLREKTFGYEPKAFAVCPQCRENLELTLNVRGLMDRFRDISGEIPPVPLEMKVGKFRFQIRSPDSRDIAEAIRTGTQDAAQASLIERCINEAARDGSPIAVSEIPEEVISELAEHMAEAYSQREIILNIQCSSCNHSWHLTFDIGSFFYAEIAAVAKRLLEEAHKLASSYGWSEKEILAMSPARRRFYLEKVG